MSAIIKKDYIEIHSHIIVFILQLEPNVTMIYLLAITYPKMKREAQRERIKIANSNKAV